VGDKTVKIDLGAVQETLVIPLWARAQETVKKNPIVYDPYAKDIIDRIDYDFSKIEAGQGDHQKIWALRAYNFDVIVRNLLSRYEDTVIVNIGAGLDTSYQRVNNGKLLWINLDLPDVVALRQKLIPDSEREITIAKSVFDFTWIDDITQQTLDRPIMFLAGGVLCYFEEPEVEQLFRKLAELFPSAHVVFDAMSSLTVRKSNKEVLKKSGIDSAAILKWHLNRASDLRKWIGSIKIIDDYSILSGLPDKHSLRWFEVLGLKIAGMFRLYNIVHVQF